MTDIGIKEMMRTQTTSHTRLNRSHSARQNDSSCWMLMKKKERLRRKKERMERKERKEREREDCREAKGKSMRGLKVREKKMS